MAAPDFGERLGFTPAWFDLGVVDQAFMEKARAEWDKGDDTNTEHYRWWAFQEFLAARRPLSADLAAALYELGATDADPGMGGSIMSAIVYLSECPQAVLDAAAAAGERYLLRAVERRRAEPRAAADAGA
ncbi:hypothetical protein [Fimbriiglobus ruber]|uniref:Uncharacterized protein n=1 Tax=Fimbriiglobus ruber TaxID=1908690 RepID=A0A225DVZ9_9BACT|nr:hypothetical protein [Fimbriiglobus ruber]OWK45720.1 hypothetical protein FRUB_02051 [Fimbriiglobus ruber]